MKENIKKGRLGESIAEEYLVKSGYRIIEKNWHYSRNAEIDIIAAEGSTLVFIEVKTRSSFEYGAPAQAVNTIKKRHILSASKNYILKNQIKNTFIRFDIVEVFVENYNFKINHIKQII